MLGLSGHELSESRGLEAVSSLQAMPGTRATLTSAG